MRTLTALAILLTAGSAWAQGEPAPEPEAAPPEPDDTATTTVETGEASDAIDPDFLDPFEREPVPMVIPDYDQEQPKSPFGPADRERYRWIWNDVLAARVNPLGLVNQFRTGLRIQLSNEPGTLFEESYVAVLLNTLLSPALGRVGARVEVSPITALRLSASYDFFGTFGLFNTLQTFDSPAAVYDDDTMKGMRDMNEVAKGGAFEAEALLQAKVGPIAVRDTFKGYNYHFDRPRSVLFYDIIHDNLHPNAGWGIQNDLDLLFIFDFGLKLGGRYTYNKVFYPDRFVVEGPPAEENTPIQRVGPAALYTFFEDPPGVGWNKPTVGVLAQWWVQHRWRTGENVSQAIPYVLVVVTQEGDFLP
jgi:hypothetical protein